MFLKEDFTDYAYNNIEELIQLHRSILVNATCGSTSGYTCSKCCASAHGKLHSKIVYDDGDTCYTVVGALLALVKPEDIFGELL